MQFKKILPDIFTLVDNWIGTCIIDLEYFLYSDELPTRGALQDYHDRVKIQYHNINNYIRPR